MVGPGDATGRPCLFGLCCHDDAIVETQSSNHPHTNTHTSAQTIGARNAITEKKCRAMPSILEESRKDVVNPTRKEWERSTRASPEKTPMRMASIRQQS